MTWHTNAADEHVLTIRNRRLKLRRRFGCWEVYCSPFFAWRVLEGPGELEWAKAAAVDLVLGELRLWARELEGVGNG